MQRRQSAREERIESLGLLKNIASIYAGNTLNRAQLTLQRTLEHLSGVATIDSDADDPARQAEADSGSNDASDAAPLQVANLLTRAATLSTGGSNGPLNPNQANAANREYQDILTEIGNIGSATSYRGDSVVPTSSAVADVLYPLRSELESLTSAESNITSTNYGRAASDLAKYQVLSQTGISALLHVNGAQQDVLRLVQ